MIILRNILFFSLMFILGLFFGVQFAVLIEAAKDQMLAGGAIIMGYGIIGSGIFLILAIILYFRLRKKSGQIRNLNIILFLLALGFVIYYKVKYDRRQAEKKEMLGFIHSENEDKLNREMNNIYSY